MTGSLPRVFARARLSGADDLVDLVVADGRFEQIRPSGGAVGLDDVVDLGGALVVPGLVEAHIHLEKAFLLDRLPRDPSTLAEAIAMTTELKAGFTRADMRSRALRLIRGSVEYGVTALRAHVEVDDVLALRAIETMLELREELAGVVGLQVVAFPQDGLTSQRHARRLLEEAVALGVDVIGGIPYADDSATEHLDLVFAAAERSGLPIDLHIDLTDDPSRLDVVAAAERTIAAGMQDRVTVGHLTSLGSVEPVAALEVADLIARAGISVVTLPGTDAFLGGRGDDHAPRRGLTPVRMLLEAGVNVAVATNNVQNAFTPFGRGRVLDAALLLATLGHFGSAQDAGTVVDMVTGRAAQAIGLTDYGLTAGAWADFAVFDAVGVRDLLGSADRPWLVVKGGRPVGPGSVVAA
ncbi:MAG TPA: amidohydrolase family protein [Marmoricola sp.]|jgi:cytosine deaminase|nr:amidohydrolase family protein [Marmoricola sp.]